jgi:peroxiredoxin
MSLFRILFGCCVAWTAGAGFAQAELQVGDIAPDFTLPSASGASIQLESLRSRGPVVLVFSRDFPCKYSRAHMLDLQQRYRDFREEGAEVVAVFREEESELRALRILRTTTRAEFPLLSDYLSKQTGGYSPTGYAAYVIDRQGKIRAVIPGTLTDRPDIGQLLEAVRAIKSP